MIDPETYKPITCWLCEKPIRPQEIAIRHKSSREFKWCIDCAMAVLERARVGLFDDGLWGELFFIELFCESHEPKDYPPGIMSNWKELTGADYEETQEGA